MHVYICTACTHDLHDQCRTTCEHCDQTCLCLCHFTRKVARMSNPENEPQPPAPVTPEGDDIGEELDQLDDGQPDPPDPEVTEPYVDGPQDVPDDEAGNE